MNRRSRASMYDVPEHMKFGYAAAVEKAEIRRRLIAEGHDPDGSKLHFAVEDAYMEAHKDDPTYADKSAARRVTVSTVDAWKQPHFTREELVYLENVLEQRNSFEAMILRDKIKEALK